MVDSNIKKVIIQKSELPAVDITNLTYNVRYRIVSEDKNRASHWSEINNVGAIPIVPIVDYAITTDNTNRYTNITWNPGTTTKETSFDVYIKWIGLAGIESDYNYEYITTTVNNFYSTIHPSTLTNPLNPLLTTPTKKLKCLVQRPTYPKEISASATLFETSLHNI